MGILYGTSNCILIKPRPARKLSELEIDSDKDWLGFGITNVKELAASMTKGDILFFDGVKLVKLSPGPIGTMLTTHGFGSEPTWSY